ncbi:uncharacterized protein SPSK_10205 [Sporothrix schenckii 1099-18]|uniref:Uncharacterized protein n=1 Tax=Sporothrix schenckii 1099-18 TaxID=1397361 RepID=A0A0F2M6G3_SPOSC|nr:uncharacterized protein SPSK_10205 [Sporothrix schenckii 1099-18]KJR84390.1 hypothetical protein SPSK_10205 [Sporothrix schenckii 1099-18]
MLEIKKSKAQDVRGILRRGQDQDKTIKDENEGAPYSGTARPTTDADVAMECEKCAFPNASTRKDRSFLSDAAV